MKNKDGRKADRAASRGRESRKAKTHNDQVIAERNAAQSPLLRLPIEIRGIILRMVVGDKVYHLHKCFVTNYDSEGNVIHSEDDEDREWELKRSICVNADAVPSIPALSQSTLIPTSPSQLSPSFETAHQKCTSCDVTYFRAFNDDLGKFVECDLQPCEWRFFSGILAASREIYREAIPLFWRTSRFCFEEGDVLDDFISRLTKTQRANLRHVVLCHTIVCDGQTEHFRKDTSQDWLASKVEEGGYHALMDLDCLELHLLMIPCGWNRKARGREIQLESAEATFKALEDLRFLRLKRALVSISYAERALYPCISTGEWRELAERYRRRLLDPEMLDEERLERVTDRIKELKQDLEDEEKTIEANQKAAQRLQTLADDGRLIAVARRDEINDLEAVVSRHNAVEIKDVLRRGPTACQLLEQQRLR